MRKIWISSILSIFFCSVTANAANLLANPHFDYRTTNWAAAMSPYVQSDWSDLDAVGSLSSGSIMITNSAQSPPSYVTVSQCVAVNGGTTYAFGAKSRIPPFQSTTGMVGLMVIYFSSAGCSSGPLQMVAQYPTSQNPTQRFVSFSRATPAPATAVSAQVNLWVSKQEPNGIFKAQFDDVFFGPTGSCVPDSSTLCLNERFSVTAKYTTGETGDAHVEQLTPDSGYLWFFDPANAEAIVKVLNGCGLNGRYWVFAGGLTDVNVELTVTDRKTGLQKTYRNDAGHPFAPIQDTDAFATCP